MLYSAFQSARQRKNAPSRGVIYIPMEIFLLAVIDAAISSWRSEPAARLQCAATHRLVAQTTARLRALIA